MSLDIPQEYRSDYGVELLLSSAARPGVWGLAPMKEGKPGDIPMASEGLSLQAPNSKLIKQNEKGFTHS